MQKDWNGLDKAIFRLGKSTAELPEVFRRLTEGEPVHCSCAFLKSNRPHATEILLNILPKTGALIIRFV